MGTRVKELAIPVVIIALGVGWLLTVRGVLPGVNWVWVIGLAVAGVLLMAVGGLDRVTAVVGPLLIVASCFALLRQTGRLAVDTEVPLLVIVVGVLLLLTRVLPVPSPKWLVEPPRKPPVG